MKTFFLFRVGDNNEGFVFIESMPGTVVEARAHLLSEDAFADGQYRIFEDTSSIITKSVETTRKPKLTFDTPRKRGPRQPKPEISEPKPEGAEAIRLPQRKRS